MIKYLMKAQELYLLFQIPRFDLFISGDLSFHSDVLGMPNSSSYWGPWCLTLHKEWQSDPQTSITELRTAGFLSGKKCMDARTCNGRLSLSLCTYRRSLLVRVGEVQLSTDNTVLVISTADGRADVMRRVMSDER